MSWPATHEHDREIGICPWPQKRSSRQTTRIRRWLKKTNHGLPAVHNSPWGLRVGATKVGQTYFSAGDKMRVCHLFLKKYFGRTIVFRSQQHQACRWMPSLFSFSKQNERHCMSWNFSFSFVRLMHFFNCRNRRWPSTNYKMMRRQKKEWWRRRRRRKRNILIWLWNRQNTHMNMNTMPLSACAVNHKIES